MNLSYLLNFPNWWIYLNFPYIFLMFALNDLGNLKIVKNCKNCNQTERSFTSVVTFPPHLAQVSSFSKLFFSSFHSTSLFRLVAFQLLVKRQNVRSLFFLLRFLFILSRVFFAFIFQSTLILSLPFNWRIYG